MYKHTHTHKITCIINYLNNPEELNSKFRSANCSHSQLRLTPWSLLLFSFSNELFEKLQEFLFVNRLREERADV